MLHPVTPELYWVEFDDANGQRRTCGGTIEIGDGESFSEGRGLSVDVSYDGSVLTLRARASDEVTLRSCTVYLHHDFNPDEHIIMNGYQSWTDTHLRTPKSVMRRPVSEPSGTMERFAPDGSGDHRFVSYDGRPGHLHGFTYAVFGERDDLVLLASLDETHGFTKIYTECEDGALSMETECPSRRLEADSEIELCRYLIAQGDEDEAFDRWFALMGISPRPSNPLAGYTSWHRHDGIDAKKIKQDLKASGTLKDLETEGATLLFRIDDGYCKVGDWLDIDKEKFPEGLAPLAKKIARRGFVPGLWLAPFVCERESRLANEHSDWLLCDDGGQTIATGSRWGGTLALDTRNPDVRKYVRKVIRTAVKEWGFRFLKLDFLYAACMLPHDGMNRGELMADGVSLLRKAAGKKCLLLGCGVPLASAFGQFEYCRIGRAAGVDWNDTPSARPPHRENASTESNLGNTLCREALDGRAFRNDPDVFFLCGDSGLSEQERLEQLDADARHSSVLLTSDDLSSWGAIEQGAFRSALSTMLEREEARRSRKASVIAYPGHGEIPSDDR